MYNNLPIENNDILHILLNSFSNILNRLNHQIQEARFWVSSLETEAEDNGINQEADIEHNQEEMFNILPGIENNIFLRSDIIEEQFLSIENNVLIERLPVDISQHDFYNSRLSINIFESNSLELAQTTVVRPELLEIPNFVTNNYIEQILGSINDQFVVSNRTEQTEQILTSINGELTQILYNSLFNDAEPTVNVLAGSSEEGFLTFYIFSAGSAAAA